MRRKKEKEPIINDSENTYLDLLFSGLLVIAGVS